MSEFAYIKGINHYGPRGELQRTDFEWEGDSQYTCISIYLMAEIAGPKVSPGDTISFGPFRLRILDFSPLSDTYTCLRVDNNFYRLRLFAYRLKEICRLIKHRLLQTAIIWNLARYEPGLIPDWQDIHLVRRIREAWKK